MRTRGNRGFIELLLLVVVALVIIFLVGLEPSDVWTHWIKPILEKGWEIIVAIARAIASIIKAGGNGPTMQPSA